MRLEGFWLMYIPYRFGSNLPGTARNLKCRRMLRVLVTKNVLTWCFLIAAVIPSLAFDWFITKKRRNLYLLPSYCLRLLALPYSCRTATQKPTPVYAISASGCISHETFAVCKITTYPRASTVAQSLTIVWNFARISSSQESARINAFHYVFANGRRSAACTAWKDPYGLCNLPCKFNMKNFI